jgi:hypothetical protein
MAAKFAKIFFSGATLPAWGATFLALAASASAQESVSDSFPSWSEVRSAVQSHLATLPDLQPGDLITAADAAPALKAIEQMGWSGVGRGQTASKLLEDGSFLARELRSAPGRIFMRRVSGYRLIYDRLDRVSQMPGGQQLIHDMIRLPDGHRYAQFTPHQGAPPMTDFLPKGVSGKAPRVPDIDKPTGRVYTQTDLLTALEAEYRQAASEH